MDDNVLILQFLENASERAFEELVRQHAGLVYSVALRKTGNHHQAEDITQQVFSILAQKSGLGLKTSFTWLPGCIAFPFIALANTFATKPIVAKGNKTSPSWIHHTITRIGIGLLPFWMRRWTVSPNSTGMLYYCVFFEKKGIREIGDTLGISEEAAKKRVVRALEKLRNLFMKRGIPIGTAGLSMVLEQKTTAAISFEFQLAVSKFAIKTAAAKGGLSLSSLTQLLIMNTIKYKIATVAILACLLTGAIWHVIKDERFHSIGKEATTLSSKDVKKKRCPCTLWIPRAGRGQCTRAIARRIGSMCQKPEESAECLR